MGSTRRYRIPLAAAAALAFLGQGGCGTSNTPIAVTTPTHTTAVSSYQVSTLVADTATTSGVRVDPTLVNAWGLAVSPSGTFWISSNHGGVSDVYDGSGNQRLPPVTIPSRTGAAGAPTGIVFNPTSDFVVPQVGASKFIFAGEDGTISAWSSGTSAVLVATNPSANAVYKGLAMAQIAGNNFLFATNFKEDKIDVYDKNFAPVLGTTFVDTSIPTGYAPFGIAAVNGQLFVTYAKQKGPDNQEDQSGAGFGFVNIFNTDGTLAKRFASAGTLNSPWAIAVAPATFGDFSNDILIGNFGDGTITAFDPTGNLVGQLRDSAGHILSIDGLWALLFISGGTNIPSQLYFTAGPGGENHGGFGVIQAQVTTVTVGAAAIQ